MRNVSSPQGSDGRAVAIAVIDDLAAQGLAFTAANYELWLNYRTRSDPELARAIERALSEVEPITQADCDGLYERHFVQTRLSAEMVETSGSLSRELAEVLACLRRAGETTTAYGDALDAAALRADPAASLQDFSAMVRELVAATRTMTAHQRELATQIAHSAAQVESLQTSLSIVKTEALTDALTGIANRRRFDAALSHQLRAGSNAPVSLILADIDHFKRINDTWGHPIGDQVIRYVAKTLARLTPAQGLTARHGGEEFAILLPGAPLKDAHMLAEAMRAAIRAVKVTKRSTAETIGTVTASFGVAQWRANETEAAFLSRADDELYRAKTSGRDRVAPEAARADAA